MGMCLQDLDLTGQRPGLLVRIFVSAVEKWSQCPLPELGRSLG